MPPVIFGIAIGIASGYAISTTAAGIIGGVIGGALIGGGMTAMSMFSSKVKMPSPSYTQDTPRNTASTVYPVQIPCGSTGMAGNKIRVSAPGGKTRNIILGFGEGPLHGIQRLRFNDKDFDQFTNSKKLFKPGSRIESIPAQTDFPLFKTDLQSFRNTSTLWLHIEGQENTGSGFQSLATVEGLECYQLADLSKRAFSRNPAVIAVTYLRDIKGLPFAEIDIPAFQALEAYCDVYGIETNQLSEDLMGAGSITTDAEPDRSGAEASRVLIDQTVDALARFYTKSGVVDCSLFYDFGAECAVRICRYTLSVNTNGTDLPISWTFNGSNDGDAWTTLQTITNHAWKSTDDWTSAFDIPSGNVNRYRYYRIHFTASNQNQIGLRRWKMFSKLGSISRRCIFDYCFDAYQATGDIEKIIGGAFTGTLKNSEGKWKPLWLHPQEPVFHFSPENIQNKSVKCGIDEIPNLIRMTYRNRARDWRRDTLEVRDDDDIAVRGEVVFEESCDFLTEREAALRRAQFWFDHKRYLPGWVELSCGQYASGVEEFDVVTVSHPLVGTNKTYYVEERKEDKQGCLSFRLRDYSTHIFHGRLANDQERLAELSGGKESSVKPASVPAAKITATAHSRGASLQWDADSGISTFFVCHKLQSVDLSQDSGWSDWLQIQGTSYTFTMSDTEVSLYGGDAWISLKVKTKNSSGSESVESEVVTVRAAMPKVFYFEGNGTAQTITLPFSFLPGYTKVSLQGLALIRKRTGENDGTNNSLNCWEFLEDATNAQIVFRNDTQLNAVYEISYTPVSA